MHFNGLATLALDIRYCDRVVGMIIDRKVAGRDTRTWRGFSDPGLGDDERRAGQTSVTI